MVYFAVAAVAVAVISAAVSTYSAYQQAEQQKQVAKTQQKIYDQEAADKQAAAGYAEQQYRRRAALILGKESAIFGASGMDPSTGSPLMLELDNTRQSEMEALNIRRTGAVGAQESIFQGQLASMKARFAESQKGYALAAGATKAGSSILSSWSSYNTGGTYYDPGNANMLN